MTIPANPAPAPEQQPEQPQQPQPIEPDEPDIPPPTGPEKEIALYQRIDELQAQLAEARGQKTQPSAAEGVSLPPPQQQPKPQQPQQPSAAYENTGHAPNSNSGH